MYRLISDVHSELWPENINGARDRMDELLPPLSGDSETTLLLAGDIGSHRCREIYGAVIERLCERFKEVVDIPGNHFWYGGTNIEVETPPAEHPNYEFGSTFVHGDVVAATLWADFRGGNPLVELACEEGMNDFEQIDSLTVERVKRMHAAHVAFLRANIAWGCVVMTHFAPCWKSIPERFLNDSCNGYYASALENLILDLEPGVWVHGHIHSKADYMIGRTRVIGNPAGYGGKDHDPLLRFEV